VTGQIIGSRRWVDIGCVCGAWNSTIYAQDMGTGVGEQQTGEWAWLHD
jgi:hypothetical protein